MGKIINKKSMFASIVMGVALVVSGCSGNQPTNVNEVKEAPAKSNFIMVSGDTVSKKKGCVLTSQFEVGDDIVFRMNAVDPLTNTQIEDAVLKVHLSTGDIIDMKLGEHPPNGPNPSKFWTAVYTVTENTPTGKLDYHVTAEKGEMKGEFKPFNVEPSLLTIVDSAAAGTEEAVQEAPKEQPKEASSIETKQNFEIIATNFKFDKEEYHVKAGEKVTIKLTSKEGVHGIRIKGLEKDVTIEDPNGSAEFTPTKPGKYPIECSIFCGTGHETMSASLVVIE